MTRRGAAKPVEHEGSSAPLPKAGAETSAPQARMPQATLLFPEWLAVFERATTGFIPSSEGFAELPDFQLTTWVTRNIARGLGLPSRCMNQHPVKLVSSEPLPEAEDTVSPALNSLVGCSLPLGIERRARDTLLSQFKSAIGMNGVGLLTSFHSSEEELNDFSLHTLFRFPRGSDGEHFHLIYFAYTNENREFLYVGIVRRTPIADFDEVLKQRFPCLEYVTKDAEVARLLGVPNTEHSIASALLHRGIIDGKPSANWWHIGVHPLCVDATIVGEAQVSSTRASTLRWIRFGIVADVINAEKNSGMVRTEEELAAMYRAEVEDVRRVVAALPEDLRGRHQRLTDLRLAASAPKVLHMDFCLTEHQKDVRSSPSPQKKATVRARKP